MKTEDLLSYEKERKRLQADLGPFVIRFEPGAETGDRDPGSACRPRTAGHAAP